MPTQTEKAERFVALHQASEPLLMPNPWDRGSARLLASFGFEALATTSSGFAATLGRLDGSVTRDEAIGHAGWIAAGTDLPVSADLENCFADDPDGVAETVRTSPAVPRSRSTTGRWQPSEWPLPPGWPTAAPFISS